MSHDRHRLADYLTHILDAIERIESYTEDMIDIVFLDSPMVQDAVIRNVEIIEKLATTLKHTIPSSRQPIPNCP